jgi:hypothetical protein
VSHFEVWHEACMDALRAFNEASITAESDRIKALGYASEVFQMAILAADAALLDSEATSDH